MMFHFFIPSLEYCLMHNVMIFWEHPVYSFRVYLFVSHVCFFFVLCMLFSFIVGSFEIFLLILRICRFQCVCDGCIDACMHTLLSFLKVSLIWLPLCAPRYIMDVILKVDALDFHPKLILFFSSVCNMRIYTYTYVYVLKNETTDLMFALISSFMPRQIHAYALPWISKYEFCKEWTLNSGGKNEKKKMETPTKRQKHKQKKWW